MSAETGNMKKIALIVCLVFLCALQIFSQNTSEPRKYIAYRTVDSIHIDGLADEKSWKEIEFSHDFIDIEGIKEPTYQTNMKMLWDDTHLYFYAKMEEPHIWATLKERDTVIFYNNDFEIFIDPDGDTYNYLEFEMNALNTVWDLFLGKPYREASPIIDNWDFKGLRSAVHIEGSLNDPTDTDDFWSVEIAIPWSAMEEANVFGEGHKNKFWRINFSRVNWDFQLNGNTYSRKKDESGKFLPEYNWVWSPQGVINMHEPEHWGYVFFSTKEAGKNITFNIPDDEKLKRELFKLYRKQKTCKQENDKWCNDLKELEAEEIKIAGISVKPRLENHSTGWNIIVDSPFTEDSYAITEEGRIIKL